MGLKADLTTEVEKSFKDQWSVATTSSVPDPTDLLLNSNDAKDLELATVLYADLDGSTSMVDSKVWYLSAEVYKSFLRCAGQVIRSEGGTITAYDGDRVMAIFTGTSKNSTAARCGLKIHWAVKNIIQPAFDKQYPRSSFPVKHVVGIDTTQLRAARIGVHGDNDLVWVGRAANYAAKLTTLSPDTPTWITKAVYDSLNNESKLCDGKDMWSPRLWTPMGNLEIYCSTYWWRID